MSLSLPTFFKQSFSISATAPAGDEGNATIRVNDAWGVFYECEAASSATGVVEVQFKSGGGWLPWPCIEYASGAGTFTQRAAAASITLADNDVLIVPCPGMYACRFNLDGTSASGWMGTTPDLTSLIQGFINASSSAPSSTTNLLPVGRELSVTFSLDTSIYASGDVLADTQVITNFTRAADQGAYLTRFILFDQDDQTAADMRVLILKANSSLGTENSAPNISDANGLNIVGNILVAAAAWYDMGGFKMATVDLANMPIWVPPASGTRDIYVGLITLGTPTQTASGIKGLFYAQDGTTGS